MVDLNIITELLMSRWIPIALLYSFMHKIHN